MALKGQAKTDYQREWMRKRRLDPAYRAECKRSRMGARKHNNHKTGLCEVCGYSETIDTHHEGELRVEHILCPNCHALITRGLTTLGELKGLTVRPNMTPLPVRPLEDAPGGKLTERDWEVKGNLPNCPDGRYRPISKEQAMKSKAPKMKFKVIKKEQAIKDLKARFDVRCKP